MTTPIKKGTVAEAMAAVDVLHRQVVKNQETLDTRMSEFDAEIQHTLDQWTRNSKREKETLAADFEELRTAVAKKHSELSGRVDELGTMITAFKQTVDSSRETTLEIKKTVDSLQNSLTPPSVPEPVMPVTTHVPVTFGESWAAFQKSPWYPWARFAFWIAIGILVYHFVFAPFSTRSGGSLFPNIIRPNVDVNTPVGAATVEVSQPPFRDDHASRAAFGRIFAALDEYVRSGQISDFEGYYNEFGKRMQESIDAGKYEQWAGFWNRLATVCHRHGAGANDLQAFNANLQSAAKVVAARDGYSQPAGGNGLHSGGMFPGHATATYGDIPGSASSTAKPMVPLQPATDVPNQGK